MKHLWINARTCAAVYVYASFTKAYLTLILKALSTFETLVMMTFAHCSDRTSSMRVKMKKGYKNTEFTTV